MYELFRFFKKTSLVVSFIVMFVCIRCRCLSQGERGYGVAWASTKESPKGPCWQWAFQKRLKNTIFNSKGNKWCCCCCMQGGCPGICTFQKEAELQISLEVCQFKQKRTHQFRYSLVLCGFVNSNFGLENPAGMLQLNKSQQICGFFTSGQLHNSALNAKKKITKSKVLSGNDCGNTATVSTSPSNNTTRLLHTVESGPPRLPQQSRYVCTHTS